MMQKSVSALGNCTHKEWGEPFPFEFSQISFNCQEGLKILRLRIGILLPLRKRLLADP